MPRKPMPWFRFWVDSFGDRKIERLTPAQRWAWAGMLGAARESPEPGRLLIADGVPMTVDELAKYADVKRSDARRAVDLACEMGMARVDDGVIVLVNWRKRQPVTDDVNARVQAHRKRSKEQRSNVTSNGTGTGASRASAPATETDTEQQTDTPVVNNGGNRHLTLHASNAAKPPECSRHPTGNPTDQPCAGCARVRAWHEQRDELERAEQRDAIERAKSRNVLADLEQARRDATRPPADWRQPKETA